MMSLLERINSFRENKKKGLILLLDPDKIEGVNKDERLEFARQFAEFIFLGGSLTHKELDPDLIREIKEKTGLPLILFPANSMHLSAQADGILFLSLLSGRNPEYLIGHHVSATPFLKKLDLEILPTGYLLIGTGSPTTAEYITQTAPIPRNKSDIAATTALAGQYLGKKISYLDAGSGADSPVSPDMVQAVKESTDIPLIVGGGIRDAREAESILEAGADLIVIGNLLEESPESGMEIGLMVKGFSLAQE
jgi:phosphoglycerol geranylgeranyltransferase